MIITTPDWLSNNVGFVAVPDGSKADELGTTVYEPAEDTFLMLDALQLDLERIVRGRLHCSANTTGTMTGPLLVVEIGSGAGLLTAAVSKALSDSEKSGTIGTHCVAVDLNPAACLATAQTCMLNGAQVDVVRGDLLTWMRWPEFTGLNDQNKDNVYGSIDILLFNPPYVRGSDGEPAPAATELNVNSNDNLEHGQFLSIMTNAAWLGGGPDGVDVLKRALHQAADLLSERGVFYALMIDYNYKALVRDEMCARQERGDSEHDYLENSVDYILLTTFGSGSVSRHLACKRLLSRHVPGERLAVYRVYRPHILDSTTSDEEN